MLNDSIAQQGVAGSFGWCMADYNTHREFGSGRWICYHGVMDMFRNPKLSAAVYASQKTPRAPSDIVLEDLPPAWRWGSPRRLCWRLLGLYQRRKRAAVPGQRFYSEVLPDRHGRFAALPHPPVEIQDFVGALLEKYEGMDRALAQQTAAVLNEMRRTELELPPLARAKALSLRMSWSDLVRLYYKYIGVLGGPSAVYRFEAVWHGRAVRTVVKEPVQRVRLECTAPSQLLTDGPTWDCAPVSLRAIDQNGNLLPYCGEAVQQVAVLVDGPPD